MRSKKGVELSVNMMIVIVIALLVLIVLVYILMNGATNFNKAENCGSTGGICTPTTTGCSGDHPIPAFGFSGCDKDKVCCIKAGS